MNDIPKMVEPREGAGYPAPERISTGTRLLDHVVEATVRGGFDADVWHVMQQRDNALVEQEILSGAGSSKFVYRLIGMRGEDGEDVTGISVVGARHLAATYGGIRHRIVASTSKRGSVFTFTSYPHETMPMSVTCSVIHELAQEDDFYSALVEISDVKTGASIQVEASENHLGKRRDGTLFERPQYAKIAQSKAYRNGVLAIIRQDVLVRWKREMLALGKADVITESVLAEKRAGVLKYAASQAVAIDRHAVEGLTLDQVSGLGLAARESVAAFTNAAAALDLLPGFRAADQKPSGPAPVPASAEKPNPKSATKRQPRPMGQKAEEELGETPKPSPSETPHDPKTGEISATVPGAPITPKGAVQFEFG